MNAVISVLMLTFIFYSAKAALDSSEYGKNYARLSKQWHDICLDVTGATQAQIEELRAGNFIDDEKIKRFVFCEWRVSGILDKDLKLNEALFFADIPETDKTVYTHDSLNKCFYKGKHSGLKERFDMIYRTEKCLYDLCPKKYPLA